MLSRATAAHVEYWPLQQLIWEIEGGLSYNEMPVQSQQLIDQLVPEYKGELREDFLTSLQSKSNKVNNFLNGIGFHNAASAESGMVGALVQEYQRIHQTLIQNANNYQALAHNFVHVLPGNAPNPGPAAWSRVNSRVYARLTGDAIYGQIGTLEIRVLPSAASRVSVNGIKPVFENVNYTSGGHQYPNAGGPTDLADVPLESTLLYPNETTSQVDTIAPVSVGGGPPVGAGPTITAVSPILPQANQTITITGSGFGTLAAYNGDSAYIQIDDLTHPWTAGHTSSPVWNWITLNVSSWADSKIVLAGFTGRYGMPGANWTLQPGDQVQVQVWNAQTGAGPAAHSTTVAGGAPSVRLSTPALNGTSVSVNGVATTTTPGATISQIAWNWGDGTPVQIGWFPETHTYMKAGNYAVSVTAADSNGQTASAQTNVEVSPSAPSMASLWMSQVVPSANGRTAGQLTLNWNVPDGSACELAVSPAIQNLIGSVPVTCNGSQIGWTASIPNNPKQKPVQYTFRLTGTAGSVTVSSSLSVYALPSLTYGGGTSSSTPFSSVTNDKAYSTKPVLCPLQLGCGIDFGLSDPSTQSGSPDMTCVPGTAKCDGLAVAGVVGWGLLGAVAGDYDSLQAEYAPLNSTQSGYTEYLEVRPQVGIVSIEACQTFEGGAGTMPFVQLTDSSGGSYNWSPDSPEDCANLVAGPLGTAIEKAYFFSQDVMQLQQTLQPLIQNQILDAQSEVQIGSAGAQILLDLGNFYSNGLADSKDILPVSVTAQEQMLRPMTPCTKDSVTPCVPVWQPIIQGGSPYDITVSSGAALVSLGTNGAGDLVLGHSEITIGGLAVPGMVPAQAVRPASSDLVSVNISPATVIEGAQFTVSGIAKNVTGGLQAGATVQISALVSGSSLPLTTVTTSSNGTFSAVLNAPPVAGSILITATVQATSPRVQGTATLIVTAGE